MIKEINRRVHLLLDVEEKLKDFQQEVDEVVYLATHISNADITYVSLIDSETQFLKGCFGIPKTQFEAKDSICNYTLQNYKRGYLHIPDTAKDERFKDNPYVVGPPFIKTYLSFPLVALNKYPLGTLCLSFNKVVDITEEQIQSIEFLANKTIRIFNQKLKQLEYIDKIEQQARDLEGISRNAPCSLFISEYSEEGIPVYHFISEGIEKTFSWLNYAEIKEAPRELIKYVHHEDEEGILESIQTAVQSKTAYNIRYRIVNPITNEIIHLWTVGNPTLQPSGKLYYYGMTQDVSIQANYVNSLKTMINDISHTAKQPVAILQYMFQLLESGDVNVLLENLTQLKEQVDILDNSLIEKTSEYIERKEEIEKKQNS